MPLRYSSDDCPDGIEFCETLNLDDILNGNRDIPKNYSLATFKNRLIEEGYFQKECSSCGWNEVRIGDDKVCLKIDFLDDNSENKSLENIRLLCPNCSYTNVGRFHSSKVFCK